MIADLHAHYPMHLTPGKRGDAFAAYTKAQGAGSWWKNLVLKVANDLGNYPDPGRPAVTIPNLQAGDVRIVLSVLYVPFDEMDLGKSYGAPPAPNYFPDLLAQLAAVEADLAQRSDACIAHNPAELDAALAAGKVALIHAVEGGFHLGNTPDAVRDNVHALAKAGVAYITLSHLFWRQIATNAPAIPFLPDWIYEWWFPQPAEVALTDLGREAVRAMVDARILIDLTHMSERSLTATFDLLDEIDPARTVPVIVSHGAYRFGKLKYNLTDPHIRRVAERNGVIGLIACDHYLTDGIRGKTKTSDESFAVLRRHIDKLVELTGGYDHIALGSDLDGFIKPSLAGLELPVGYTALRAFLEAAYGAGPAARICSENARRVLGWWAAAPRAQAV